MKIIKSYILGLSAVVAMSAGLAGCQDDFDDPAVNAPVATITPNTSILELKEQYWDDATNYIQKIGTKESGEHIIIHGRVVSTDEAGNVFKSLVIQDETAALAISINSYNLYLKYRRGQEVVLDVTDMYIGKYNGLQQLGMPEWYENGNAWEASFMAPEFFENHVQLNGLPEVEKLDTVVVNSFSELASNPEGLRKWQSQIVRFNNVYFQNGGSEQFSSYHSSGVNQNIVDVDGSPLSVRTSGYSNFWNKMLPSGNGDVVGILSYYGTSGWQLILNDYSGCMNFGNPTLSPGTEDNPYTVEEAIETEKQELNKNGWVTGYIVGAVAPEVETVSSDDDVEWTADVTLANTLVIGATPDTKEIASSIVISLPSGSALRQYGNLRDNAGNYKKQIWVKGTLATYMGTYGVTDNHGTVAEFKIDGVDTGGSTAGDGDGTQASPYSVGQIIAMNPSSTAEALASGVWVTGYVVGWADMSSTYYINGQTSVFSVPATLKTNILVAASADVTDYTKCIGVQLPTGNVRNGLNLQDNPGNLGKQVMVKGDIMKYSGVPGVKNTSDYVIDGGGTDVTVDPVGSIDENFNAGTSIPSGWTQVQVAGNKTWYVREFSGNNYITISGYQGTAPFDQWLLTPPIDMSKVSDKKLAFDTQVNGYGSTTTSLEVYVLTGADPSSAVKTKLSPVLATAPASGYSEWVNSGSLDLSGFTGTIYIGFRYYATSDANYATWCVDNVKVGTGGGSTPVDPVDPVVPTGEYKGDFNSFNGGEPKASPYGTYTNASGWTAEYSIVLGGTTGADANPRFGFIGDEKTMAPTLNGNTAKVGRLVSPVLAGGIKTLSFNYGFAFAETKCSFTVRIYQGDAVVKEDVVTLESLTQKSAYTYSLDVNVTGEFRIEIVNNCLTGSEANKDRVSIWNLTWTD